MSKRKSKADAPATSEELAQILAFAASCEDAARLAANAAHGDIQRAAELFIARLESPEFRQQALRPYLAAVAARLTKTKPD